MLRHAAKLFCIVILLASCKQSNDNSQLAEMLKRVRNSNVLLRNFNDQTLWSLEEVMQRVNPTAHDLQCVTNGRRVTKLSEDLVKYIDALKEPISKEKVREIYDSLVKYKKDLAIMMTPGRFPGTSYYIENKKRLFRDLSVLDFISDSAALSTASIHTEKWIDENFSSADTTTTNASLLKIKNDVLSSEQILLKHFKACTAELICGNFERFAAIIVMNSSYIQSGDPIEVMAGMGQFTSANKPTIFIDGKNINVNQDGHAIYSLRPTGKPGKYSIPVEIEFYQADGTRQKLIKNLNYTIAK